MKIKLIFAWYDLWVGAFYDHKNGALYILPLPMVGVRIQIWGRRCYVLRKRGVFYRPNAAGYTSSIHEAGRFTEAEAKEHAYPHGEPVTMHHVSAFL